MSNFQFDLVAATVRNQNILNDKQSADSEGGIIANDLLQAQYDESTTLLNSDQELTNSESSSDGNWNTTETNNFSINNANYQNDAAVSQTGDTNGSTAVTQAQSETSQDSTNISNLASLAQTIIQVGSYVANLIGTAYT